MSELKDKITSGKATVAVVGLGYVGLPLAAAFAKGGLRVIGYDISKAKIAELKQGIDRTMEVGEELKRIKMEFHDEPPCLKEADVIIVCVPTPVDNFKIPDLSPVEGAAHAIGKNIKKGAVVVLESTVYPGVTEEIAVPIIEKESGLKYLRDFKAGYSPERINPGDKEHTIDRVTKVVSGCDVETLDALDALYSRVTKTFRAGSIRAAEAAKVIENIQRDLNIALMNELAVLFDRMGIPTKDVLEAAGTKWNFHRYTPGLVGGHCIPVDPYYLVYKAWGIGYHPEVITAGRRVNDSMPAYVTEKISKAFNELGKLMKGSRILVMGLTFKENVPDTRNSPIRETICSLKDKGADVWGYDPFVNNTIEKQFGVKPIASLPEAKGFDCVIIPVAHDEFKKLKTADIKKMCNEKAVVFDVRGFLDRKEVESSIGKYLTL